MDIHNKRDSKIKDPSADSQVNDKKKNSTTNFITIVIYYITTDQFEF